MSIRQKILLYFSVVTIALVGIAFLFIYTLFYEYREEEFQQQQKEKISTTLRLLSEIKGFDEIVIEAMDEIAIHDLYDEKLLIFDKDKALIYSSIDDTPIPFYKDILNQLTPADQWVEQKDGLYDVVGMYLEKNGSVYFGISKAYDSIGYQNLGYLRYVLWLTFTGILLVVIFMSYYLSGKITKPIVELTGKINSYRTDVTADSPNLTNTHNEVIILTERFNELMMKMNDAFAFQKHAIHHISHELKTPIAVLVSNFERMEKESNLEKILELIHDQKVKTMNLGEIINLLLEIAKAESGNLPEKTAIRVDELLFDLAEELKVLHPDFRFAIQYACSFESENDLMVYGNSRLLKAAFLNLMVNCIQYNTENKAEITISPYLEKLLVRFSNRGPVIGGHEHQLLFQHFFRGENSVGKKGFGLGLVFVYKIISLHNGEVSYISENHNENVFSVSIPLS